MTMAFYIIKAKQVPVKRIKTPPSLCEDTSCMRNHDRKEGTGVCSRTWELSLRRTERLDPSRMQLSQERQRAEKDDRTQICCFNNNYIVYVKALRNLQSPTIDSILGAPAAAAWIAKMHACPHLYVSSCSQDRGVGGFSCAHWFLKSPEHCESSSLDSSFQFIC